MRSIRANTTHRVSNGAGQGKVSLVTTMRTMRMTMAIHGMITATAKPATRIANVEQARGN